MLSPNITHTSLLARPILGLEQGLKHILELWHRACLFEMCQPAIDDRRRRVEIARQPCITKRRSNFLHLAGKSPCFGRNTAHPLGYLLREALAVVFPLLL